MLTAILPTLTLLIGFWLARRTACRCPRSPDAPRRPEAEPAQPPRVLSPSALAKARELTKAIESENS